MKLIPSNVGANKRNLAILGALAVVLIGVFIYDASSSSSSSSGPVSMPAPVPMATEASPVPPRTTSPVPVSIERRVRHDNGRVEDYRPTLKLKEGTDVSKIDPTVRVELLAKLREMEMKGGVRSVFAFGAAPPPPVDPIKVIAQQKADEEARKIAEKKAEEARKPPGPPPPPAIPLKFFGYSARGATKRAFFLDGDDIDVASENELIKNRYKVVKIGVNSVVVEDTQFKDEQTLPLVAELQG